MGWEEGIVEGLPLSYTLSSALSFQPRPVKLLHLFPRLSDSDFFFFLIFVGFLFFWRKKIVLICLKVKTESIIFRSNHFLIIELRISIPFPDENAGTAPAHHQGLKEDEGRR